MDRFAVQNWVQTVKMGLSGLERDSEKGTEEFFNRLGSSRQLGE
jgi:hypothetical protein